ncbi:aminotransferase class IV [Coriobacteriia bacterium Es71-Z0120]|uniref:aminotransferase class IV n=1 Tax=Parvivirga hydrogeniphila TaxID=2939460 RepID=UPI002260D9D0|nr:aminotransferase class IV [Parvivirga hydrogeniphila]MCL4078029.1 aminotransferase class IV [Parvivirga hydrogeniphila]
MNVRIDVPRDAVTGHWPTVALRETCRVALDRSVPLWPYHRRRLAAGGCSDPVLAAVESAAKSALAKLPDGISSRTRLTALVDPNAGVSVVVQRRLSSLDAPTGIVGVPVVVAEAPTLPRGAAKPADRTPWDDAQRAAVAAGGNQAILVTPDGSVIDGGTAAIIVRTGSVALAPLSPPATASVALAWALDHAARLGVSIRQAPLSLAQLEEADEVVYLNAFGGARADRRGERSLACAIQAELDRFWLPRRG